MVRPAQMWAHEETNCNAEQCDSLLFDPSPTQSLLEAECPRSRRLIVSKATQASKQINTPIVGT